MPEVVFVIEVIALGLIDRVGYWLGEGESGERGS